MPGRHGGRSCRPHRRAEPLGALGSVAVTSASGPLRHSSIRTYIRYIQQEDGPRYAHRAPTGLEPPAEAADRSGLTFPARTGAGEESRARPGPAQVFLLPRNPGAKYGKLLR
jgi:hypothetical protein